VSVSVSVSVSESVFCVYVLCEVLTLTLTLTLTFARTLSIAEIAVREYRVIVVNYYSEYISGAYLRSLVPVLQQVSGYFPRVAALASPLMADIVHATSLLDLRRRLPSALVPLSTSEGSSIVSASAAAAAAAAASTSDTNTSHEYRPRRLESSNPLDVERVRTDYRDLWFNERLLDLIDSSASASASVLPPVISAGNGGGGGGGGGGSPYAPHRTFDGHSIAQNALKVASDIPLVTGDVFRFRTMRFNWAVTHAHMFTTLGRVEVHNAVSGFGIATSTVTATGAGATTSATTDASAVAVEEGGGGAGSHLHGAAVIQNMENLTKLQSLMSQICHLSTFIDDFPALMEHYFEASEVWWYKTMFNESFEECLSAGTDFQLDDVDEILDSASEKAAKLAQKEEEWADVDHSDACRSSMAFLYVNAWAVRSLHQDCPSEVEVRVFVFSSYVFKCMCVHM